MLGRDKAIATTVLLWAVAIGPTVSADPPSGHFTIGPGSVVDNHTGLVWQRSISATSRLHSNAGAYCSALVLDTYDDWRLPTVPELASIVDETRFDPAIDPIVFPSTPAVQYWSSTPDTAVPDRVWTVDFMDGASLAVSTSVGMHLTRCVR